MKKVIRLSESDLMRVVKRIIKEEELMDLPKCNRVMKSDGGPDKPGSGQSLRGPIDSITYNATVSPEYQGYTVHKDGRPFCFIPNR